MHQLHQSLASYFSLYKLTFSFSDTTIIYYYFKKLRLNFCYRRECTTALGESDLACKSPYNFTNKLIISISMSYTVKASVFSRVLVLRSSHFKNIC